jgi:hypothetical protein
MRHSGQYTTIHTVYRRTAKRKEGKKERRKEGKKERRKEGKKERRKLSTCMN